MKNPVRGNRQRGVALITALLVVALASIAAVEMASRQHLDIRRAQNIYQHDQAYVDALATESWAKDVLASDLMGASAKDTYKDNWANLENPPEFEGAKIALNIDDLQSRFNINSLLAANGKEDPVAVDRFNRLVMAAAEKVGMNIGPNDAKLITNSVLDWIDPDVDARYPGAEDDYYLRLEHPYRPANRPMASVSELRLIRGVKPKLYHALEPALCALPFNTPININTANPQVIQAVLNVSEGDAKALAAARLEKFPDGFDSVGQMLQLANANLSGNAKIPSQGLSVDSHFFLLTTRVELGRAQVYMRSVMERVRLNGAPHVAIVRRDLNRF